MLDLDVTIRRAGFVVEAAFAADAPIVALFGRSGSGKSTLVNAIAGVVRPERGRIAVGGRALFDSARGIDLPPESRRVGYVFQDALLFPHMNVAANLAYGERLTPAAERFVERDRVVALLDLGRLLDRRPASLSGGERQRAAIGRALLASPRILLMDEPLASLDAPRKAEILAYIELLRDELRLPIVYVSHALEEVTRLADSIVLLAEGRVVAQGARGRRARAPRDAGAHAALRGGRGDRGARGAARRGLRAHYARLRRRRARGRQPRRAARRAGARAHPIARRGAGTRGSPGCELPERARGDGGIRGRGVRRHRGREPARGRHACSWRASRAPRCSALRSCPDGRSTRW